MPERIFPTGWLFRARRCALACALLVAVGVPVALAADALPVTGPGATKEEVIKAYGWPTGQSQAGTKEILTYPQGRITLENGKVEKVDFATNVPWPAPRPRPGPASPSSVKKVEAPTDFWVTDFAEAQKEAQRRNARILALFIGSDWSPPSRQFQEEVAFHPDFVNSFTGDYVFLRLDFPTRTAQPAELRDQNNRLRTTYGVTTYPALLVLSPGGTVVATVDLTKPPQGAETYRDRVIAAIREVRALLVARPPPPDPAPVTPVAAAPAKAAETPNAGTASMTSAFSLVIAALAGGLALAVIAWWLLWSKRGGASAPAPGRVSMAERISDAAGGLPTIEEIAGWSREKLRAVVAGLAESDGYEVIYRSGAGDGDLALSRGGDAKPAVLVSCQAADAGTMSLKRVKEVVGLLTVEDIAKGWLVAPKGFAKEANEFAAGHPLILIDAEYLQAQLRALPAISLPKVLARTA